MGMGVCSFFIGSGWIKSTCLELNPISLNGTWPDRMCIDLIGKWIELNCVESTLN